MIHNEMTDDERDAAFAHAQQATFDRIFGASTGPTIHDEVEKREVDFKFGRGINWMDMPRLTPNNKNDGLAEINQTIRESNGYLKMN